MRTRAVPVLAVVTAVVFVAIATPWAYVFRANASWPSGATVPMYLQLGTPSGTLIDGATSWNDVAAAAISLWDRHLTSIDFVGRVENRARMNGDGINDVFFADQTYGDAFGPDVLAIATLWYRGEHRTEGDVLFNRAKSWDSYRGPRRSGRVDFRRVALHAFGHVLGLAHPDQEGQSVAAIMNSDSHAAGAVHDDLQPDDIQGVRALYGGPPQPSRPPLSVVPRVESIQFRRAVETKARGLGAPLTRTFVDIEAIAIWSAEYFWYRVSYCDHATAIARVFAQIEGRGVQPVCAEPAYIRLFPSLEDTEAFRTALETEYRDVLKSVPQEYHISQANDALFLNLYHSYRWHDGMSHAQAMAEFDVVPDAEPEPDPPPTPPVPPRPAAGKYDGWYDVFLRFPTGPGSTGSRNLPRFLNITNGIVSSRDATVSGVVDNFGAIRFTGPCTINTSTADYIGNMNQSALAGANFGEGRYTCRTPISGTTTWQANQSR